MADEKKKKEKKHWFKDLRIELKKVTWLTPRQLVKNTTAVIVMVLIVSLIVFVLDFVFEAVNTQGVEKLKGLVQNNEIVQSENTIDNTIIDGNLIDENSIIIDNEGTENNNPDTQTEENNVVEE